MNFVISLIAITLAGLGFLMATHGAPFEQYVISNQEAVDQNGHVVHAVDIFADLGSSQLDKSSDVHIEAVFRDDEDEDEDETTVRGPGAVGILSGITGIFQGAISGNLGQLVESTFNFVPPVYQGGVQGVFDRLVGRPPKSTSTTTTSTEASARSTAAAIKATTVSGDDEDDHLARLLKIQH